MLSGVVLTLDTWRRAGGEADPAAGHGGTLACQREHAAAEKSAWLCEFLDHCSLLFDVLADSLMLYTALLLHWNTLSGLQFFHAT